MTMNIEQSARDELGTVICEYKHPGLRVVLVSLGVGAVLWLLFAGVITLWDGEPLGLMLTLLMLALFVSITAIVLLPVGLLNRGKKVIVYREGLSYPAKRGRNSVCWDEIAELRRQTSGPIFPGLLGVLLTAVGGSITYYTIKQVGGEEVVLTNQQVQGIDALAEQIAAVANLTRRSTDHWSKS